MIFSLFKKKEDKWGYRYRSELGKYFKLTPEESQKDNFNGTCYFDEIADPIDVGLRLSKGEKIFGFFDDLSLMAYRRDGNVGGYGITFRKKVTKGVYLRAGKGKIGMSKSLQEISKGTLYISNKGIFFDGDRKNLKLPWTKIMKDRVSEEDVTLEPTNGEPIIFNGKIDPEEAAIFTIVSQAHEEL